MQIYNPEQVASRLDFLNKRISALYNRIGKLSDLETTEKDSLIAAINEAILSPISVADNFANDTAAATGGVPVGGLYHTSGAVKIRLV